jgi:hypothetical protein
VTGELPAPECRHELKPWRIAPARLSTAALATIERQWQDLTGDDCTPGRHRLDRMVERRSLAWQSCHSDDLTSAIDEYEFEDDDRGLPDDIEDALLDHAVACCWSSRKNGAEGPKLEWG